MTFKRMGTLAVLVVALCLVLAFCTAALAESGTSGTCTWEIDENWVLTIKPTDGESGTLGEPTTKVPNWPWLKSSKKIQSAVIQEGVKVGASCAYLFSGCMMMESVDIANLDTSSATDMSCMFKQCMSLTSLDLSTLNTSNVTSMNAMFQACGATSIDLSSFNTANVVNMKGMFQGCSVTALDLSSFKTAQVTDMEGMFGSCSDLKTITVTPGKWSTAKLGDKTKAMFDDCAKLVGGAGTACDGKSNIDATYARVDGGPDSATPGYLTAAKVPETGDNTPIALTAGLLLLSGAALIALRKRAAR